jgi:leader peptidase (prepilin peptidase)/N-methyltransferase
MLGAFLGASVAPSMFIGFLLGLLPALVLSLRHGPRAARKMKIPFGPFLIGGAIVGWFAGEDILGWYLGTLSS